MSEIAWMALGECRTVDDPKIFFPDGNDAGIGVARKVCMRCPVRIDCLNHALQYGEFGIWGGTTERERRIKYGVSARLIGATG